MTQACGVSSLRRRPDTPREVPHMTDRAHRSSGPTATGAQQRSPSGAVRVVAYDRARPDHRGAFRDLNLAWIEKHFIVEPRDRHELDDPDAHIIAHGGEILMAEADGPAGVDVLGTCALL